jgi:predicted kinase
VRLCEDDWLHDLAIDLWDQEARARLSRRFVALAGELLGLGTSVVLESGFWHRSERDELRDLARAAGARVELHLCELPLDELWRRVSARNEAGGPGTAVITREHLVEWEPLFERPTPDELAAFDPPSLSPPAGP